MSKRKRRTYSDEFKQDAHANLRAKRKLNQLHEPEITEDERMELARLRSEVKRLRLERDILKKPRPSLRARNPEV